MLSSITNIIIIGLESLLFLLLCKFREKWVNYSLDVHVVSISKYLDLCQGYIGVKCPPDSLFCYLSSHVHDVECKYGKQPNFKIFNVQKLSGYHSVRYMLHKVLVYIK